MSERDKYRSEVDKNYFSLSKMSGKKIVDIIGYVTKELGDYTFSITRIVFEDGSLDWVDGEHEIAYAYGEQIQEGIFETIYEEEE